MSATDPSTVAATGNQDLPEGKEELLHRPEVCEAVRDFISLFANPIRLRILCSLSAGEASVGQLVEVTGARQPAVSQQLSLMRATRLVSRKRVGNRSVYRISDPLVTTTMGYLASIADQVASRSLLGGSPS